jgi:hypothetical protein
MRPQLSLFLTVVMIGLFVASASAEQPTLFVQSSHSGFSGVITKIESGMLFVKTDTSLQPRVISPRKAERVGLYDAKVGETLNMLVDSGNVLMDVSRTDRFFPEHHFVAGQLHYADPYWGAIQISTPEGPANFEVDPLSGSKLSTLQDGTPVTIELDADNVMVDIQWSR